MNAPTPDQLAEWKRLATEGYQPRGNRAVWAQRCALLIDAIAEFQYNAVEMARKADIAEAERDDALAEVERLQEQLSTARQDAAHGHAGFEEWHAEASRLGEEMRRG